MFSTPPDIELPLSKNSQRFTHGPDIQTIAFEVPSFERQKQSLGDKILQLKAECGWSFDELASKTGLDKKLILGHVNKGKNPYPRTLKLYADAFSKALNRSITVSDLIG